MDIIKVLSEELDKLSEKEREELASKVVDQFRICRHDHHAEIDANDISISKWIVEKNDLLFYQSVGVISIHRNAIAMKQDFYDKHIRNNKDIKIHNMETLFYTGYNTKEEWVLFVPES